MSPRAIAEAARRMGIDLIAVADHNTAGMVDVMADAAREAGLEYLYALEIQTSEEVHVLAYFDRADACHAFAHEVYSALPDRPNVPEYFGDQVIVDIDETILREEPKLLLNSLTLSLEDVVRVIETHGGLAVPAHVDRETFGLIAQLGFPPSGLTFPLVETLSGRLPDSFRVGVAVCSSDAHRLEEIGRRRTRFDMKSCTIDEIIRAAREEGGRSVRCIVSGAGDGMSEGRM